MSSPLCELRQGLAIFPFVIFVATMSSPVFALEQHAPLPGQGVADPRLQALVGRWEGRVDFKAGGPGGLRSYRILVIHSIKEEHGQLVGRAEYGYPEAPLAPVHLQVEVLPRGIVNVRFMASQGSK